LGAARVKDRRRAGGFADAIDSAAAAASRCPLATVERNSIGPSDRHFALNAGVCAQYEPREGKKAASVKKVRTFLTNVVL